MRSLVVAISLAALAGTALPCEAQLLKQRKPGLWEMQYSAEGSQLSAESAQMRHELESMPPEKRAQMEAYLQRSGVGMRLAANGTPTMVMRLCLSAQDIAEESGQGFMKGVTRNPACRPQLDVRSPKEVHVHAACASLDAEFAEVDGRIYDISPEHYSVDLSVKSRSKGDVHVQQQVRWLGADCGAIR